LGKATEEERNAKKVGEKDKDVSELDVSTLTGIGNGAVSLVGVSILLHFMILPDMLKNAPMFKRVDPNKAGRGRGIGLGRGRAAVLRKTRGPSTSRGGFGKK